NVVKLPNVSASVPQLLEAISELQAWGYKLPPFPSDAQDQEALDIRAKYGKVLGSAVNPVLREGNSDRRVAEAVKAYAKANPTKMGPWRPDSLTHVAHMDDGDFYGAEQSYTVAESCSASIVLEEADGYSTVLKKGIQLSAGEVIDASAMDVRKLRAWAEREIDEARRQGLLLSLHLKATMMKELHFIHIYILYIYMPSLHLKATMMKELLSLLTSFFLLFSSFFYAPLLVSDPVIFGHVVRAFYAPVFEKYAAELETAGADPSMGLASVLKRLHSLPEATRKTIEAQIEECYEQVSYSLVLFCLTFLTFFTGACLLMLCPVQTQLSTCTNKNNNNSDNDISDNNCSSRFDPRVMGNVANVGLMAQKAEEYGSHDKTFVLPREGMVKVMREGSEEVIFSHKVQAGDIWRMCSTKDEPIKDWVRLAVDRARKTMDPVIFWLDPKRAHDGQLILKVNRYLATHDLSGLDISIKEPVVAMRHTLGRARVGLDTVSVTGNVLRDYLTDLFPILELGTSSKMLSIVPLLGGGGLYETGAGGSAPKHVQQVPFSPPFSPFLLYQ
ncbi:monomeric isocitrate dehydrogenase-domain-containing protein, partial [Pavlovales sp. CCMP2436]